MNTLPTKEKHLEHILTRRGPFLKDWTEEKTVIFLLGVPVMAKIKQPSLQEFRVFGIPVLQKKQDEHTITQRVLGVCVKKRANTAAMASRINAHIDETQKRLYPDEVPVSELEMQRQLDMLEQLQDKRRNRA